METFSNKKEIKGHLMNNNFNDTQANALLQSFDALLETERKTITNKKIDNKAKETLLRLDNKLAKLKTDLMHWVIAISSAQVVIYITTILTALKFLKGA